MHFVLVIYLGLKQLQGFDKSSSFYEMKKPAVERHRKLFALNFCWFDTLLLGVFLAVKDKLFAVTSCWEVLFIWIVRC